jgi:hypothetical protein
MPLTCPGDTCPMCIREHCNTCSWIGAVGAMRHICEHSWPDRHARFGVDGAPEHVASEVSSAIARTETKPLVVARLELTFAAEDGEAVALFFESLAALVRSGYVKIVAE